MLIQNAKAFIDGKFQEKTDLLIRDGRISATGTGLALMVVGRNAATPTFFSSRLMWRTASSPCMVSMPLKAWI